MSKPIQNEVRKSVFVSKELNELIEKEARRKGTTFSGLVRMILIEKYYDNKINNK